MKKGKGKSKDERTEATPEKTGAPPATFLSWLKMEAPIQYAIEEIPVEITTDGKIRAERQGMTTDEIKNRVWFDLMELANRVKYPRLTNKGMENSAKSLATVAVVAAELLEHLSSTEKLMIRCAASENVSWPVLLRLGGKWNNKGERCLEGAKKAKAYLNDIRLDQDEAPSLKVLGDREGNIFKRAAELLLHELLNWREKGVWQAKQWENGWSKKLLSLDYPMTTDNVDEWWSIAKSWMDEQWKTSPELFNPLVGSCKSKGKSLASDRHELYQSEVKSTVIDKRLQEAFRALVSPADLSGIGGKFRQQIA